MKDNQINNQDLSDWVDANLRTYYYLKAKKLLKISLEISLNMRTAKV